MVNDDRMKEQQQKAKSKDRAISRRLESTSEQNRLRTDGKKNELSALPSKTSRELVT